MGHRPIVIIDCFVHSSSVEAKLMECVHGLKSKGMKVMLVTNTPVEKELAGKLDHLLYDSENRLFDDTMEAKHIVLMKSLEGMQVSEVVKGVQRHGLSVLRNIRVSLDLARAYGYTHFHRVEVDDLMGDISLEFMKGVPDRVRLQGKKGLFFLNDNEWESNISFHYMYCEIEHFRENVTAIDTQEDYQRYLSERMGTDSFMNVEEFVRHNLDARISDLMTLPGGEMHQHFPDTSWNTETSQSNLEAKFGGCTTRVYRAAHNGTELDFNVVLTYNYCREEKTRVVELISGGAVTGTLTHSVRDAGWWQTSQIGKSVEAIRVSEDGREIYTERVSENSPEQRIDFK